MILEHVYDMPMRITMSVSWIINFIGTNIQWWHHQMGTFSALLGPLWGKSTSHWCGALMFSLICAWSYGWANNQDAGDVRRHCAHYDVTVIWPVLASYQSAGNNFVYWILLQLWYARKFAVGCIRTVFLPSPLSSNQLFYMASDLLVEQVPISMKPW